MELINSLVRLQAILLNANTGGKSSGFVPTMGALHNGHAFLVDQSVMQNDITIASIFVNPAQFNDVSDLEKYPRTPEADQKILSEHGCDYLFAPAVKEMYPEGMELLDIDLGPMADVMEGKYRKGHFQGMVTIVHKLFRMIQPARAYFGEKDFQQLAIIRLMVKKLELGVQIIGCPTVRDPDGLALSSRNMHLTAAERAAAPVIFNSMIKYTSMNHIMGVDLIKEKVISEIEKTGLFKIEYFEIVHSDTLKSIDNWVSSPMRACIAVKASRTRLIDNIGVKFAARS
jgi:pantoate--beta-alanine ligase